MKSNIYWTLVLLGLCACDNYTVTDKFPDGSVKEKCELINGKRNGTCVEYFADGSRQSVCSYTNDVLDGDCKFYHRNGSVHWTTNFSNGHKNGLIDYYDSLGRKYQSSTFKNSELDGISIAYYNDGSIKDRMTYKNGKLNGVFESFYKNGKIDTRADFQNGHKEDYTTYDSLGKEIEHLIKYEVQYNLKKDLLDIKILNPLYDVMVLKVVDNDGNEINRHSSLNYQLQVKITTDTLKAYLLDIDTLNNGQGVVKCLRYFEYYNKGSQL